MRRISLWGVWVVLMLVAACQSGGSSAAPAIETYLQAKVNKDATAAVGASCAAFEAQARAEVASFSSMNPKLEDMSCSISSQSGGQTLVACTGKIVTLYNGETREWSLADHLFVAVNEGGEWRMCGYQ